MSAGALRHARRDFFSGFSDISQQSQTVMLSDIYVDPFRIICARFMCYSTIPNYLFFVLIPAGVPPETLIPRIPPENTILPLFPAPRFLLLSVLSGPLVSEHVVDFPVEVAPGSVLAFYNLPVLVSDPPAISLVAGYMSVVDHSTVP
jgi:hypothetical protein